MPTISFALSTMKYLFQTVFFVFIFCLGFVFKPPNAFPQNLTKHLLDQTSEALASQVRMRGDPIRGGFLFHTSTAGCVKCHSDGQSPSPLGPKLTDIDPTTSDIYLIESVLHPSQVIRKGYETVSVLTTNGQIKTGILISQNTTQIVLRELTDLLSPIVIPQSQIDEIEKTSLSIMPQGLVDSLRNEGDFYDLMRYVFEVVHGGSHRASELRPTPEELVIKDDSVGLDHAGILQRLGAKDLKAGKRIYLSHCKNCHGVDGNEPTLPLARSFSTQPLKNGSDPYSMFMTLTKGSGLMASVQYLSPKERYQVVHYIREALMEPSNPQYEVVDSSYLAGLPRGTGLGELAEFKPRDFGPALGSQIGTQINNALTIKLDDTTTASYDLHRMKLIGIWENGFLDLTGTHHYRQRGERMPQIEGALLPGLDGWRWAYAGSFDETVSMKPPRGPLDEQFMRYEGYSLYDNDVILHYTIEERSILESLHNTPTDCGPCIEHTLHVGPGSRPLELSVAKFQKIGSDSGVYKLNGLSQEGLRGAAKECSAIITEISPKTKNIVESKRARELDLGTTERTILVRFRTTQTGTLVSSAPPTGKWTPNGKTLFLRGDELVFDIGWVGALRGKADIRDGEWHVAAVVVGDDKTQLFVDGKLLATRQEFHRPPVNGHVFKIGSTATDFGGDFKGDIGWVQIYQGVISDKDLLGLGAGKRTHAEQLLFEWDSAESTERNQPPETINRVAARARGDIAGLVWGVHEDGRLTMTIPAGKKSRDIKISVLSAKNTCEKLLREIKDIGTQRVTNLTTKLSGNSRRWPETIRVRGQQGADINGYALDTIPIPFSNPWNTWMRTSALDFFPDGRAVVTTHGGDVYIVSGIDHSLSAIQWNRFAAGLFEPFGVKVVDGTIYVTCRDGMKRLHDYNSDGEADFIESFWNDDDVSCVFHGYNFNLQVDDEGNFYLAKAGQHTNHHRPGAIMKVPPRGGEAEVVAWGIRTPNGMGRLADGRFTVSDNQGPWMPAGKISAIEPDGFYGNMPINAEQDSWLREKYNGELPEAFDQPFIWMPQELDSSCGGQVWVDDPRFGPLSGRLLHSSFGKGWLYYLSLQEVDDRTQAAIIALPHQWDAGVMRLRVNPADGQLYGTGLSGWQGPAGGKDGCFQRLRYTGKPCRLLDSVAVEHEGIQLHFNFHIDPESIDGAKNCRAEMWDYLWSRKYGSDQFSVLHPGEEGRDEVHITDASLIDPKTIHLKVPDIHPCDQFLLEVETRDQAGESFLEKAYLTIHAVPDKSENGK